MADSVLSLDGRFEFCELLGEGAMGEVFRAIDRVRGMEVAVKTLKRLDARSLFNFKAEFRSLAGVVHPNVLQLYELLAQGDDWLLTMELVKGCDFLRYVRPVEAGAVAQLEVDPDTYSSTSDSTGDDEAPIASLRARAFVGSLDEARLRNALVQLAAGLHEIHARGFVHRDLKPANVLVFADTGRVVICDFGLLTGRMTAHVGQARMISLGSNHSTVGELAGTLAFMAPEQAEGRPLSEAADWYAVGAMLYLALTLRVPIEPQADWDACLRDKLERRPADPRELAPDAPADLCALAMSLLEIDPARRAGYVQVRAALASATALDSSRPANDGSALIGRARELNELTQAFARTRAGEFTRVIVSGASGMGKSAVIDHFLATRAVAAGALVLAARCYEREALPFKAFDSLIDALSTHLLTLPEQTLETVLPAEIASLATVFPVLRRMPSIAARVEQASAPRDVLDIRERAADALWQLCRAVSQQQPLVLYIDDLQWGDLDSAELFQRFQRATEPAALMLLTAYRSEDRERSPLLAALRAEEKRNEHGGRLVRLSIDPLGTDEACELTRFLLRDTPDSERWIEPIVREAVGSPFFLRELAAYVRENEGAAAGDELRLERVVAARIARLSEPSRRMLELISVAGRPERRTVLKSAAQLGPDAFPALHALQAQQFVLSSGDGPLARVQPYHDRIRETAYDGLSAERRAESHRRLAEALERESEPEADAEALFKHWKAAGEGTKAAHYAVLAATSAERSLAFGRAAELYGEAAELSSATAASDLQERRAQALVLAGRGEQAAAAFELAAGSRNDEAAKALRVRASIELLRAGRVNAALAGIETNPDATGLRLARSTLRSIFMLLSRRVRIFFASRRRATRRTVESVSATLAARAERLWWLASTLASVDFLRGNIFSAELTLCALEAQGPRELAVAHAMEAIYAAANAQKKECEQHITHGLEAAAQGHDAYVQAVTEGTIGVARLLQGDWARARQFAQLSARIHRSNPMGAWDLATMMFWDLQAAAQLGDVRDLIEQVPEALRDADRRNDVFASTYFRTLRSTWAWLGAGQPERAREELATAEKNWDVSGYQLPHYYITLGIAELALYEGKPEPALARLDAEWSRGALLRSIQHARCELLWLRGRLCLAAGAPLARVRKDAAALAREKTPWSRALAAILRAGIASREGSADVPRLLQEASEAFVAADMKLHAAVAQARLRSGDASALEAIRACGVKEPEGFIRMIAPGF